MQVVEIIPYRNFKEKIRLVKLNIHKGKIIIYDHFIFVERIEDKVNQRKETLS